MAPPPLAVLGSQPGAAGLQVEVGGGIRDETAIRQLLDLGVTRVIIGTKAVSDFEWFCDMALRFKGKLVLGLDARGGTVATHGWLEDSHESLVEFGRASCRERVS